MLFSSAGRPQDAALTAPGWVVGGSPDRPDADPSSDSLDSLEREAGYAPPAYLDDYYWWAYVHPNAVRFFERQWMANLILWGNYLRLRDDVLAELGPALDGRLLQVACVYGDLTKRVCARAAAGGGTVDVVDALPVQLRNLRRKLPAEAPIRLLVRNAGDLRLPDASYDQVLVFFLLHEQPRALREATLAEVARVVRPGGKVVIVDYARPRWWHPARWLWYPMISRLEPFASDLWHHPLVDFLPESVRDQPMQRTTFFGGLYQKLVFTR
jgi:ubiquinone/menaquinone biosynthesis C-methylase UbiE